MIAFDIKYKRVLFPYVNGFDLNTDYLSRPSRWIINFFDWPIEKVNQYPICYEQVIKLVKPERDIVVRETRREKWWQYGEKAMGLYGSIKNSEKVIVTAFTSKFLSFSWLKNECVFSNACIVNSSPKRHHFIILQSNIHESWVRQYSSTLDTRMRYAPSDVFETFPFPQHLKPELEKRLEIIGETYHEHRRQLMLKIQLGLTKTYNAFHAKEIQAGITTTGLAGLDKKAIEKQYGKEVWNLWNHLQKTPGTCSIEEAIARIIKLRELHLEMDEAVLEAYGWNPSPTLPKVEGVELRHDFYEVDYLPENDRVRYTIHPDARKEILKRLLELNHKIHDEEVKAGLWDKKKTYGKVKGTKEVGEPEEGYGDLFNQL